MYSRACVMSAGGTAYCLGAPAQDCWYLYTLNPPEHHSPRQLPDQTLEVLMTELDPQVMRIFTQEGASSAADATQVSEQTYHHVGSLLIIFLRHFL